MNDKKPDLGVAVRALMLIIMCLGLIAVMVTR